MIPRRTFIMIIALIPVLPAVCGAQVPQAALIERLSSSVVFLQNESRDTYGTGVLVRSSSTVILTSYHFVTSSGDAIVAYLNTSNNTVDRFTCRFFRSDPEADIVLLTLALEDRTSGDLAREGFRRGRYEVELPYTNQPVDPSLFAGESAISRGAPVLFLGFPLNYGFNYEKRSERLVKQPIVRSGIVASGIFEGEFLIDAMASSGNSGSPVFVQVEVTEKDRFPGYRFAGIIKEFQNDALTLRMNGAKMEVPYNAGLSVVIPASRIRRLLERKH